MKTQKRKRDQDAKILESIKKALKKAKTFLVVAHIDPDGDSIGSMLAMGAILEKLKKEVYYFCPETIPRIYRFLPGADQAKTTLPDEARFEVIVALDASDLSRLGKKIDFRSITKTIINIDHHPDNTLYGDINYAETISSTAELVFKLAKYLKVKIDKNIAENLYVALITDSGNFRYEYTTSQTFQAAAELLKAGVKPGELNNRIYEQRSLPAFLITSRALSGIGFSGDRRAAWVVVTQNMMRETEAKGEDLTGLVDQVRSIAGVEVAILFREEKEDKVKVNFRSKEKVNVSEIAAKFGGGGHLRAAGAIVCGNLERVKKQVISEVLKTL